MAYTPKCHDSTAWAGSDLGSWVNGGGLPWPFCFSGDSAFRPGCAGLLTPGTSSSTTDVFKYVQSRGRMPVEQAFGILVKVWGILWRDLSVHHERRAPLVSALIHLHNIRQSAGASLDIEGGHQVQFRNGKQEWGLAQRKEIREEWVTETVWTQAPKIDKDGRPVELMGALKTAFKESVRVEPSQMIL